jgi:hypothetical protein
MTQSQTVLSAQGIVGYVGRGAARRQDMSLQPVAGDRQFDAEAIGFQDAAQARGDRAEQLIALEVPAHCDIDDVTRPLRHLLSITSIHFALCAVRS